MSSVANFVVPKSKSPVRPATPDAIRNEVARCEQQIGTLMRERNQLHAERHAALLESNDLAELRSLQDQLQELDGSVAVLQEKRRAFEDELKAVERGAAAQDLKRRAAERDKTVRELKPLVARMQDMVDELARLSMKDVPALDARYCHALPETPEAADMVRYSRDLPALIMRRFEAWVKGSKACRGTIETGHQLIASKRVDLVESLSAYIEVTERSMDPPPPTAA